MSSVGKEKIYGQFDMKCKLICYHEVAIFKIGR